MSDAKQHELQVMAVVAVSSSKTGECLFVLLRESHRRIHGELCDLCTAAGGLTQEVSMLMRIVQRRAVRTLAGEPLCGVVIALHAFRAAHEDTVDAFSDAQGFRQTRDDFSRHGVVSNGRMFCFASPWMTYRRTIRVVREDYSIEVEGGCSGGHQHGSVGGTGN